MRGRPNRWAPKPETTAQVEARLIRLLYGCRPHMLAKFTPEELHRTHSKMPIKTIEYHLITIRQKRASEIQQGATV